MLTFLFVLAALNPIGGVAVSIPLAMFKLAWPAWLAVALSVPLAYVQVLVVDLLWSTLCAWPAWTRFVERRRHARLEALLARRDAGLWLALVGVWFGPWLITAAARFSGYRQSHIALPMLFGLTYVSIAVALVCTFAPEWLAHL